MLRNLGRRNKSKEGVEDIFEGMRDVVDEVVRTGEEVTGINSGISYRGSIPVDIKEEDGKEILKADLPGVEKEDINIRSDSEEIEIWGTSSEDLDSNDNYQRRERKRKTFRRTVSWPKKIDEDTIHAWYEDGVLYVEAEREYRDTDVEVDGVDHVDGENVNIE